MQSWPLEPPERYGLIWVRDAVDVVNPHVHKIVVGMLVSQQHNVLDDSRCIVALADGICITRPVDARVDDAVTTKASAPPELAGAGIKAHLSEASRDVVTGHPQLFFICELQSIVSLCYGIRSRRSYQPTIREARIVVPHRTARI